MKLFDAFQLIMLCLRTIIVIAILYRVSLTASPWVVGTFAALFLTSEIITLKFRVVDQRIDITNKRIDTLSDAILAVYKRADKSIQNL